MFTSIYLLQNAHQVCSYIEKSPSSKSDLALDLKHQHMKSQ